MKTPETKTFYNVNTLKLNIDNKKAYELNIKTDENTRYTSYYVINGSAYLNSKDVFNVAYVISNSKKQKIPTNKKIYAYMLRELIDDRIFNFKQFIK